MPRNKPDDPFQDDDWGTGSETVSDEVPESTVDPDKGDWLKPWHLDKREGTMELVSISGATEFSDVTLHLKLGRKNFRLGLKTWDPTFDKLRKKFGPKKGDWHGTLKFRVMPHKGRPDGYVAVRPV